MFDIENKTKAMEMLLDCGCDINCLDDQGATPLMLGCLRGHARAVQVLLNGGANPDHVAAKTAKYRPLHVAARLGNEVLVRILLEAGASENARLDKLVRYTPLHLAVSASNSSETSHRVQVARTLLVFGAHVDATSGDGSTPLHMAVRLSQPCEDLIKVLIKFGADIDKLDNSGHSALFYALNKNSQIARILWDPQDLKDKQISVLFDAASEGNVPRVLQLLDADCDKAEKDAQGRIAFDVTTTSN